MADPLSLWNGGFGSVEVRRIHSFQATKAYTCPGCHHGIAVASGHVVTIPEHDPELRRHWHTPCWARQERQNAASMTRTRTPSTDTTSKRRSTP